MDSLRIVPIGHANLEFTSNHVRSTKYTLWNFLPLTLLQQFRRTMNRYFLLIACLQLWDEIAPVSPITTWAPLVLIFTLSACKEGFDDMHRRKADQAANQRPVQVLREGSFRIVPSHNVRVGELVLVTQDDEFCADMVLLSASFRADQSAPTVDSVGDRFCFIETSNIDGESNLKHRSAVLETAQHSVRQLTAMQARVICDQPNHHIYSFDARLEMQGATLPLTNDQLLLQGTFLRHTHWVIGLVVYTGDETKVGMNKQSTLIQTKTVPLDTRIDQGIVLIFLLQTVCVVIWGLLGYQWQSTAGSLHWYLGLSGTPSAKQCLILVLRFLLLCSMMIPISIKVASDLLKLAYSLFISWDLEFYDESRDVACIVNNTTIAETLGQIQVVLSDKTGTLTDNEMILRKLCIRDELYGEHADLFEDVQLRSRVSADDIHIVRFLESLVVCSTVLPSSRDSLKFEGSSPDEEALVNAAARLGLILSNRNEQLSTIKSAATQTLRNWNTLHALPFSSDRRRMTVLVRDDNGLLFLISKGADEALLPRLRNGVSDSSDDRSGSDAARRVLLQYARSGLRTLVVVRRPMTEFEFQQFESQLQSAQVSIHHRDAEVAAVFDRFERDYELIGLTGIEDKLQQDVPQTIQSIRQAGMAFWMLTGDKTETAIQIARSCNVISTFHKSTSSSSSSSDDENVLQIVGASSVDVRLVLQRHLAFLSELESPTRTRNVNSNDPSRWWTRWWPYNSPTCSADSCVDAQFPCASAVVAVQSALLAFGFGLHWGISRCVSWLPCSASLSKLYASNPSSGASSPSMVPLTPNPKAKRKSNAVAPTPRRTRDTKDNEDEQMALLSQSSPLPALPSSKSTGNLSTRNPQDTPLLSNDFYSISIPTLTSVCASSSESPAALACASDFTLVIDGAALTICLNEMPFLFSSLCAQVGSVVRNICCRVSPSQKADMVRLARGLGRCTLAIGDGANDQPMIIEADCGVGISGREGTQCARAADISFTKFRHLARLLLVHGRNSYRRSAFVAQFFFYKSVLLCIQQLAFALFSSFSGTSLFETFALMSFNTFFSSFQPLCFVFDRDLSDRTLLLRPQLYAESQRGALFTWSSLLSWLARSTLQGIIVFIIVFSTENSDPFSLGIREQASTTFTILILLLSASMLLESTTITSWSAIVMIGTWVFYLLAATSASFIGPASPEYGLFVALASRPQYWLRVLVATVAAMVPVYATKWYFQLFHPTLSQSIQFNAPNA